MNATPSGPGPWLAGIDPGRNKCGLVLVDAMAHRVRQAAILSPEATLAWLKHWQQQGLQAVVVGDGTGSKPWVQQAHRLALTLHVAAEHGTTLAARQRYWELFPPRGWRRLVPEGMRLPGRDLDDLAAQLLVERHLGQPLQRPEEAVLRTWPAP